MPANSLIRTDTGTNLAQKQKIHSFVQANLAQNSKISYNVQVGGAHYEIKKRNVS